MSLRLNREQQDKVEKLNAIREYVDEIATLSINKSGRFLMEQILSEIQPLLEKVGLDEVSKFLEVNHYDFAKKIAAFKEEINFAIDQEIDSFDPASKYKLFSKRINEMTGYEYEKYLSLIKRD